MLVGCATCRMCTGHAFTGVGRSVGRTSADIMTLGVTALARKKCKACEHPMSEHQVAQVQVVQPQPMPVPMQPPVAVPPPTLPPGWYADPFDNRALTWWDGTQWRPETKHYRQ